MKSYNDTYMKVRLLCLSLLLSLLGANVCSCRNNIPPEPPATGSDTEKARVYDETFLVGTCKENGLSANKILFDGGVRKYAAASKITAGNMSAAGDTIIGIRAFVAEDADEITVFAGADLHNPAVQKTAKCKSYGWQFVLFDEPLPVDSENDWYIGYSTESKSIYVEPVRKIYRDELIRLGEEWKSINSEYGKYAVCVYAVVIGGDYSKYVQNDIALDLLKTPQYAFEGEMEEVRMEVRNAGVRRIDRFTVTVDIDGRSNAVEIDDTLYNGQSAEVTVPIAASKGKNRQELTVTVEHAGDDNIDNNMHSMSQRLYSDRGVRRNTLYIEQFTGQACTYCPQGARAIAEAIAGLDNPERITWVAHHTYGSSGTKRGDMFTVTGSLEIADAFSITGAPMCNINRLKLTYESGRPELLNFSPINNITTSMLNSLLDEPGCATLSVERSFDSTSGSLKIKVSGMSLEPEAYITAIVTQSGMEAAQIGAPANYIHNNAPRLFLTSGKGDKLTLDENGKYSVEYEHIIPEHIDNIPTVFDNMSVAVIIHGNIDNPSALKVYNADNISLN